MAFCSIGVYSVNSNVFDLFAIAFFGLMAYVLGPMPEDSLRRAMILRRGDPTIFVSRPISLTLLLLTAAVLAVMLASSIRKKRREVFVEAD